MKSKNFALQQQNNSCWELWDKECKREGKYFEQKTPIRPRNLSQNETPTHTQHTQNHNTYQYTRKIPYTDKTNPYTYHFTQRNWFNYHIYPQMQNRLNNIYNNTPRNKRKYNHKIILGTTTTQNQTFFRLH